MRSMNSGKIKLIWVMPLLIGTMIVAFMLISPILISSSIQRFHVKTRAEEAIKNLTGGEVVIGNVSAAIFPMPHMVVSSSHLKIPGKLNLRVKRIEIYPRLIYLLQGKLLLSSLSLDNADAEVVVPQNRGKRRGSFSMGSIKIPTLWFALPPLKSLHIKESRVALLSGPYKKPFLVLTSLSAKASLNRNRLKLKLRIATNHGEEVSATGEGDLLLRNARLKLNITNLQPHLWLSKVGVTPPKEFKRGVLNLYGTLEKDGKEVMVKGTASVPALVFKTKETPKAVTISLPKVEGEWRSTSHGWDLNLSKISLNSPPARLQLVAGEDREKGHKNAYILVKGAKLDLGALRTWLKQVPPVYHFLHNLFDIVHAGTAVGLQVGFQGKRFKEISNIRRLSIDGDVNSATVMIPKVKLPVTQVSGHIHMENATLVGSNLKGHFLSSTEAENGRFSLLSLKVKNHMHPFHIDLDASGNNTVADLLPLLKRLIHDPWVLGELNRMQAKGTLKLHLHLGEFLEQLHADARATSIRARVDYKAIPYPVEINDGAVRFHNSTIEWTNLEGSVSKTRVYLLSGALWPLNSHPNLRVDNIKASVNMEELGYWLNQYSILHSYTRLFPLTKGGLNITGGSLKGPLLSPHRWRFRLSTNPQDLNLSFILLPFPFTLRRGNLVFTEKHLLMNNLRAEGGNSSLNLSGRVDDYMGMPSGADLSYSGEMGSSLFVFLAKLTQLPKELWLKTPYTTKGRWRWKEGMDHTLKASASWPTGERCTIDLVTDTKEIAVNRLTIASGGDTCSASAKIPLNPRGEFRVGLNGRITHRDLNNMLLEQSLLKEGGVVEGKGFYTSIDLGHPSNSAFRGEAKAQNLALDGYFIRKLSAKGTPKGLDLDRVLFSYGGGDWNATGRITLSTPLHLVGMVQGPLLRIPVAREKGEEQPKEGKKGNTNVVKKEKETTTLGARMWVRYLESLEGTVSLKIDRVEYGNYTIHGFMGTLGILGERAGIEVLMRRGSICNLPITGKVRIPLANKGQNTYELTLPRRKLPEEKQPRFQDVVPCIFPETKGKEPLIEGPFRVWGEIKARDTGDGEILNHLHGHLDIRSTPKKKKGVIHKFNLVSKLLDILNPLDLAQKLSTLTVKGIPYDKLLIKLYFEGDTWPIKEMALSGPAIKLVATGKLKKGGEEIDATILVGMLKTVNRIIKNIPLVNTVVRHVLSGKHGSIVSIPVSVVGPIENPMVIPLSPTAVGSEIFGIVKRTLGLPIKLLSPLTSQGKEKKSDNKSGE